MNADIIDILGFLAWDSVNSLTVLALEIKKEWDTTFDEPRKNNSPKRSTAQYNNQSIFDKPKGVKTSLQPHHIQEAYRRLKLNEFDVLLGSNRPSKANLMN